MDGPPLANAFPVDEEKSTHILGPAAAQSSHSPFVQPFIESTLSTATLECSCLPPETAQATRAHGFPAGMSFSRSTDKDDLLSGRLEQPLSLVSPTWITLLAPSTCMQLVVCWGRHQPITSFALKFRPCGPGLSSASVACWPRPFLQKGKLASIDVGSLVSLSPRGGGKTS